MDDDKQTFTIEPLPTRGPHPIELADEQGIVVLAPLIVVTVLLVLVVTAGWLLYPAPPRYIVSDPPAKYIVVTRGEVGLRGEVVRRLERGDTVWAVRAGNGAPVIFTDSSGAMAIGVAEVVLTPVPPAPQ